MTQHPKSRDNRDKFDILSALWVLACNDEISIMTYRSIQYRLNLPEDDTVEHLVEERGDLFRKRVSIQRLNEWKEIMQSNIGKRPSWIRRLGDESSQLRAIDELTPDDVFRSQFRIGRDAPKSELSVLDWGLQYIERLRKADLEARDESFKRWQLWSVIFLSVVNILVTVVVAVLK